MENKRTNKFTQIKYVLPQVAESHNAEQHFLKHKILLAWKEVIGGFFEEAKTQTLALDFKKGVLTVASLSEELGKKIRSLNQQLMRALNEYLKRNLVYSIVVEI